MKIELTDATFEQEVLQSNIPVMVDFWATWCGPCKRISPIVDKLSEKYDGKIKVGKVDVDKCPTTTMQWGVRSIPTLVLYKNGKEDKRVVGALSMEDIEKTFFAS